jgi:hypothetical protein
MRKRAAAEIETLGVCLKCGAHTDAGSCETCGFEFCESNQCKITQHKSHEVLCFRTFPERCEAFTKIRGYRNISYSGRTSVQFDKTPRFVNVSLFHNHTWKCFVDSTNARRRIECAHCLHCSAIIDQETLRQESPSSGRSIGFHYRLCKDCLSKNIRFNASFMCNYSRSVLAPPFYTLLLCVRAHKLPRDLRRLLWGAYLEACGKTCLC